ncbi:MAG: hypothetical protein JNJ46_17180 [Myxococcales bacterium]|jgi:hypothetical protein|nr:hypothetical protein [Myxococcales bacterium]
MRLRLDVPADWTQTADGHFTFRSADQAAPVEVRVLYGPGTEPAALDSLGAASPQAWLEQLAQSDLDEGAELYGVTFSALRSARGWPVTLIEGSVRARGGQPLAADAVRLLYCLQIFDAWVAIWVHAAVRHLSGPARSAILAVLGSAQPYQSDDALVALTDLWRPVGAGPVPQPK